MKKLFWLILCLIFINNNAYSQTVYDDNYEENPNYLQGNIYLQNSQYSSAINEFKKALRVNPADTSSIIGLSNSYSSRAAYYNNTAKMIDSAISDLKSALFFLKYFSDANNDFTSSQTILSLEKNLRTLETSEYPNITVDDRNLSAKKARTKGEFASAAYDYYMILNNGKYALEANIALGDIYKIFNKTDKSVEFYKKALSIKPDNSDIHLKLARTYEQMNDFDSSLKEYSIALQSSSESDDILNSLEKIWQKKVDEFPKDAEAHANLGVVFQKQKRYMEALDEYKIAEALNPSNINTKINIGILYQELQRYNQALNTYDGILKLQPENAKVLVYKAECLKNMKKNDEAISLYKTALGIEPQNTQIKAELFELLKESMTADEILDYLYKNISNMPLNADSYYEFAYELHKANKIDDAITYYKETIKIDNKKTDAYINLSQAYRQKKNYTEALNTIKQAKAIAPSNEQVNKQLEIINKEYISYIYSSASEAIQSGEYNKAIAEYQKINPATSDSLLGIAAAYQSLNNNTEAISYYKKAMEKNKNNADIPFYIASLYVASNELENAKKYLDIALTLNPHNKQAKELSQYIVDKQTEELMAQVVKLYDSQKYNESINIVDKVLQNNVKNASAYYYRALCYDALKMYDKAIVDYKSTIKYAPDMVIAYYSLGVDYDLLEKYQDAKINYQKFVENSVDDDDYRQYAQSRIKEIE